MNVAAMSASLHKWGFAGHAGALFYTSPEFRKKFPPPCAGWLSLKSEEGLVHTQKNTPLRLADSAGRYTCGSPNLQAIKSFGKAFDYLSGIGFDEIRSRIFDLTDCLIKKLSGLNLKITSPVESKEERSAIVSFDANGKSAECVEYLEKIGIYTSFRMGRVRVSVNFFNNVEDIDRFLDALKQFLDV
jgi:selenocysteine lyase/cysteine desulfurase